MKNPIRAPFLPVLVAALAVVFSVPGNSSAEEVYFFRGGFDIFSTGMNEMASTLRQKKVNAVSHSFMSWQSVAKDILERSKEKKVSYPIIILGHSWGADAAVDFANFLGANRVSTDLVIGFDPTGTRIFTKGAKRVINYRCGQTGQYRKGPGFRGSLSQVEAADFGANHFNIEQVDEVQALALKEVLAKLGRRR
jgi:hypothetical protein